MNIEDVETLVRQGNAVNLVAASCLTALLYNHAITFDKEVDKMWPTRFSVAKFLFFTNRYPVEAILLLLITYYMVDQRNKLALYIAFFFYIGGVATLVGLVVKDYIGEDVLINKTLASLPGCYATSVPSIIAGTWIAPLIVETVLFIFVVARAFYWWRDGISVPSIFMLLARDSTLYFALVFTLLLANYLVFQFGPPSLSSLLVTPSATTGCILGSHMMINMRMMAEHNGDTVKSQLGTIPVISTHDDLSLRGRRQRRRGYNHNIEFSEMFTIPSPTKDTVFLDRALTPMSSNLEFAPPDDHDPGGGRRVGFAL
ncbi:hypothetical protein BDN70DRAFT_933304 [Pholiota conissans]|uniref:DUF6533 domain-containing protein n=1 Tax=Pholiota conissans TaxID=109636 RepID=A0A9P6CTN5_9AGAR|nr:hypothetical protein BDN70DRAFT_933304 [Pholiota conissans]